MTLHVLWKLVAGTKAWDEQYAYVKGYILALEDVVRDIDKLRAETPDEEQNTLLFKAQNLVLSTWSSAKLTLTTLERMEDGTTNSPGAHTAPGAADAEDQGRVPG